jgi:hypothetical protein
LANFERLASMDPQGQRCCAPDVSIPAAGLLKVNTRPDQSGCHSAAAHHWSKLVMHKSSVNNNQWKIAILWLHKRNSFLCPPCCLVLVVWCSVEDQVRRTQSRRSELASYQNLCTTRSSTFKDMPYVLYHQTRYGIFRSQAAAQRGQLGNKTDNSGQK